MSFSDTSKAIIAIQEGIDKVETLAKYHADQVLFQIAVRDQLVVMQTELIAKMKQQKNNDRNMINVSSLKFNLHEAYQRLS